MSSSHRVDFCSVINSPIYIICSNKNLRVFTDSAALVRELEAIDYNNSVLLIMTSGNFSGVDIKDLASRLIK